MKIAVDGMGGDFGPNPLVGGVKQALEAYPHIEKIYLAGDEKAIKEEVDAQGVGASKLEIVHASQVVDMHDDALNSVRRKKDSSVSVAVKLVKDGTAEAMVSAGHTGAAVAAATVHWRLLPGVGRAGIASPLPTERNVCSLIDAGANPDAKPVHLYQYAIMGSIYMKEVFGVDKPEVGLMSIGGEDSKGNAETKEVFKLLKEADGILGGDLNFRGNVEGHDLFQNPVDVVVCNGFVGNVVLKSCESTASAVFSWLKHEIKKSPVRMAGAYLAKGAFRSIKDRTNWETYGGSPLLGVNGVCVIAHGKSTPYAMQNAIRVAAETIRHEVNPHIQDALEKAPKAE